MFPIIYKLQLSKQKILLIVILCASDSFQGTACKLSCIGSPLRVGCLKIDWEGKMFPYFSNFFPFFLFFCATMALKVSIVHFIVVGDEFARHLDSVGPIIL